MQNVGLEETQAGIKTAGRNISNLRYADDTTLMAKSWTDAKAETPILWPPHVKNWLIGKDSHAGRDWGQEKVATEDEMARWHHRLDGRESGWILGVGDGQGGLACCNSWGRKESDTTERLNWTELPDKTKWKMMWQQEPGSRVDVCTLTLHSASWWVSYSFPGEWVFVKLLEVLVSLS